MAIILIFNMVSNDEEGHYVEVWSLEFILTINSLKH